MAPKTLQSPIPSSPRRTTNDKGMRKQNSRSSQDDLPVPRPRTPESAVSHLVTPLRKRATLGKSVLLKDTFTSIRSILNGDESLSTKIDFGAKIKAVNDQSDDFRSTRKVRDLSFQCILNRKNAALQSPFGDIGSNGNVCCNRSSVPSIQTTLLDDFSSQLNDMSNSSFGDISWTDSPGKSSRMELAIPPSIDSSFPQFSTTFSEQLDPFAESQHSRVGKLHFQATGNTSIGNIRTSNKPQKKSRRTVAAGALLGDFDVDDAESVRTTSTRTSASSNSTSATKKSLKSTNGSSSSRNTGHSTRERCASNRPPVRDPSFALFDFPEATFQMSEPVKTSRRRPSLTANCTKVGSAFPMPESERKPSQPQRRRSSLNNLSMFVGVQNLDVCSSHSVRSSSHSVGITDNAIGNSSLRSNQQPRASNLGSKSFDSSDATPASQLIDQSRQRRRSSMNNLSSIDPSSKKSTRQTTSSESGCSNQSQQSKRKNGSEWEPKVASTPTNKNAHASERTARRLSMSSNLPNFDEETVSLSRELPPNSVLKAQTRPGQQRRRSSLNNVSTNAAPTTFAFESASPLTTSASSSSGSRLRINTSPSFGADWATLTSESLRGKHKLSTGKTRTFTDSKPQHMTTEFDPIGTRKALKADRSANLQMTTRKTSEHSESSNPGSKGKAVRRSSLNMAPAHHCKSMTLGTGCKASTPTYTDLVLGMNRSISGEKIRPHAQRRRSSLSHCVPSDLNETMPPLSPSTRERRHSLTASSANLEEEIGVVIKSGDSAHSIVTKTVEWPSIKARRRKINV